MCCRSMGGLPPRFALMEYLVRVVSASSRLDASDRGELEASGAASVLKAFRQQLSLFLRRRSAASAGSRTCNVPIRYRSPG